MMKLYGSLTSPYVRHIRMVLLQHELACEFVATDYEQSGALSPAKRVPFMTDGDQLLSDSSSILLHLHKKAGLSAFSDVADFDLYCLVNSAMDAEINLFLLARDGVTEQTSAYMQRQRDRVLSSLDYINSNLKFEPALEAMTLGQARLACFLSWAEFRQRIEISPFENLGAFLNAANEQAVFAATAPPSDA